VLTHRGEILVAQVRRGKPRDQGLEREPDLVELLEVRRRELGNAHPQSRIGDEQPLRLQLAQRVADRDAADLELLRKPLLGEALTGSEPPGQDVVPQASRYLLGQGSGFKLLKCGQNAVYGTRYADILLGITGGGSSRERME
jgi:hypothetical protein